MVFEDNSVTNICKILLKFAVVFKIFEYFCPFLSLTIKTGKRSFLCLADGLHDKNPGSKNGFKHFLHCGNFLLNFGLSVFFLYDLVTNKARKLEVVVSNLIMEKILSSLSLSLSLSVLVGVSFLLFLFHVLSRTLSLSLSLSLSLLNSFVDAALQRLLCGVRSSSITLTSRPFNQGKANVTKQWLGTDEANRSSVVWEQFARR